MSPLQVIRIGSGPPVALVHGWGFHAAALRALAEALALRRTVELVELPGHGGSRGLPMPGDLQGLAALLDATLPDTRDWIGWSLGGLACLQLALAPGRLRRLGLLAVTPRFTANEAWPQALPATELAAFARTLDADPGAVLARFAALVAHGDRAERAVLRVLRTVLAAAGTLPDPEALATGLALLAHSDLKGAAQTLDVPTLWLLGAADALVPAAVAETLAAWPRVSVEVVAGAGHAPFLSQPTACAARLERFLDG